MKIAHFDCFSGISGDMVLGALVDSGADLRQMEASLRQLEVKDWKISAEKVKRGALAATQVKVETDAHDHHHHDHARGLTEILKIIDAAKLPDRVTQNSSAIFRRLGDAEAKVHQVSVDQVHFHEVGAVDAIIDIVGAAIGFELLGIDAFSCSALDVGSGRVKTDHGILPVPAPATAELLLEAGAITFSSGIEKELVTPTGAAIATTLSFRYGSIPPMRLESTGYGAGSADLKEQANVLRILTGVAQEYVGPLDEVVDVIEANIDDMNPQIYGYFVDQALAAGALDIFSTAVQMKKNRPGQLVTLLCDATHTQKLIDLLFRETTTIGVRTHSAQRRTLARQSITVATPLGDVRMKVARMNGTVLNAAPEFEDCRRIAATQGIPLKDVLAAANYYFQKTREPQS
jgi:pyridinium-3,5-bisthiocarboxylic acid mononucleotide nickel chelatase